MGTCVARILDIPFCVAGGIATLEEAEYVLAAAGAEKVSVNSPALADPALIERLARRFGSQCVVVGVDSLRDGGEYRVRQYTGDLFARACHRPEHARVDPRGSGPRRGRDRAQLHGERRRAAGLRPRAARRQRAACRVPLVASGGAGELAFRRGVLQVDVDGALAASVFHSGDIAIPSLKRYLRDHGIEVRP